MNIVSKLSKLLGTAWFPAVAVGSVLGALYLTGAIYNPSWLTYYLSLPALLVLLVTSLARVNDIRKEKTTAVWHWRRMGLTLAGATSVALAAQPFLFENDFPSWRDLVLYWGFAITWITTPGQPPWWKYVSNDLKEIVHGVD